MHDNLMMECLPITAKQERAIKRLLEQLGGNTGGIENMNRADAKHFGYHLWRKANGLVSDLDF